jgi:hypothetical protein
MIIYDYHAYVKFFSYLDYIYVFGKGSVMKRRY